jgi:CRISPR-associated endonuclease Cas1
MLQHRVLGDPCHRIELARRVVSSKITSQREAARHYQRQGCRVAGTILRRLAQAEAACQAARDLGQLNGCEGLASQAWFELLAASLLPPWQFVRRVRRPPADPVNALLSLGYTWLNNRATAWIQAAGLEVNLGALHEYRAGRPSLACDLIEPLRVPAVDRWLIRVCNRHELTPENFRKTNLGVRLEEGLFGRVLVNFEQHWADADMDRALQRQVHWMADEIRRRGGRLGPDDGGDNDGGDNDGGDNDGGEPSPALGSVAGRARGNSSWCPGPPRIARRGHQPEDQGRSERSGCFWAASSPGTRYARNSWTMTRRIA